MPLMRYFLQDPAYKTKERRWKELHHLLGHIKALIMVYDNEPMQTGQLLGMLLQNDGPLPSR